MGAVRLGPDDDAAEVTAAQVRQVVQRLVTAGQWQPGDPQVLVVFDAGYDLAPLADPQANVDETLLRRRPGLRAISTRGRPRG